MLKEYRESNQEFDLTQIFYYYNIYVTKLPSTINLPTKYSINFSKSIYYGEGFKDGVSNSRSNSSSLKTSNAGSLVSLNLIISATIFYVLSIILCFIGNSYVILTILFKKKSSFSVINFFVLNLAIANLIFGFLSIPSTYITAFFLQYWPFSNFLCVFFNYAQNVLVTLIVYTLIWITMDKYWAIVRPLKLRMTVKVCKYFMYFTWIFSLFISLPIGIFTELNHGGYNESNSSLVHDEPQCLENWPIYLIDLSHYYNFSLLFIQYLLPLIIILICYIKIGIVLMKTKAPGEIIQNRDEKMLRSRKKVFSKYFIFLIFYTR